MKIIDARKLNCPQPLILTKSALEGNENKVKTIVDNVTAKENILKFCKKMNYIATVTSIGADLEIVVSKSNKNNESNNRGLDLNFEIEKIVNRNDGVGYLIGTNMLGKGAEDLGKLLMKGFIYTLSQTKPYPKFIIFLNSGVEIACENSDSLDDLNKLLQEGTEIVSCGTCLDFYQLKEKLKIGEISNMYDIVELLNSDNKVITV